MNPFVKIAFVIVAIALSTEMFAQNFGLRAGFNASTFAETDENGVNVNDYLFKPGFHAGVSAEFPLSNVFSLESDLLLSTKGFRLYEDYTILGQNIINEGHLNLYYLDIPFTVKATLNLGNLGIYGKAGPYIGVGLSGTSEYSTTVNGLSYTIEPDINWGTGENDDFRRLDYGLVVGTGIDVSAFQIGFNYAIGLANIVADNDEGSRINNHVYSLSIGYFFGRG